MKITKGTIIRTILVAVVIINMALQKLGYDVINVSENQIAEATEALVSVGSIIAAWWYNNSFSETAKKADAFFDMLKAEESQTEGE